MNDLLKQLFKIGLTVASVGVTMACGCSEKTGFLIGSITGTTIENISEQIKKSRGVK